MCDKVRHKVRDKVGEKLGDKVCDKKVGDTVGNATKKGDAERPVGRVPCISIIAYHAYNRQLAGTQVLCHVSSCLPSAQDAFFGRPWIKNLANRRLFFEFGLMTWERKSVKK